MERAAFAHAQRLDRDDVLDLVLSRSYVAVQPAERRAQLLAAACAVLDAHAPATGVTLPYLAHCFRAVRLPR